MYRGAYEVFGEYSIEVRLWGKQMFFTGLKGVKLRIYITQFYLYKFQRSRD
jgi:hypothetical protein